MATYTQLIAPSNYYRLNVSITQVSQDIANNTSLVRVVGSITGMSPYATASYARSTNSVNIDGITYAPTTAYSLANGKTVQIFSYERTVNHAADGKKNVSVSWTFTGGDTASSWNPTGTINCSQDMSQIHRASTASLSMVAVDYGNTFHVNIQRSSETFTHKVTVSSAQGNYQAYYDVATSQGITIPSSWLNSFTDGSATSGTVSVQTYSGTTKIGSPVNLGFTINVPRGNASLGSTTTSYGSAIRINVTKINATLTHHVTVSLPNESTSFLITGNAYDYTIPSEWLHGFTNGVVASGTITVQTRNGSTNIGSIFSLPFTCNVPSSVLPSVSISRTSFSSGLPGYSGSIVGISSGTYTRTASSQYSASIVSTKWTISGTNISSSDTSVSLKPTLTYHNIYCDVTDSRGRTTRATMGIGSIDYSPPQMSFTSWRCTSNGQYSPDGEYVSITPTFSFTQIDSLNRIDINIRISTIPEVNYHSSSFSSGQTIVLGDGKLYKTNQYTVKVAIQDQTLNYTSSTRTIPVAEVLLNFPGSADALGIGMYSQGSNRLDVGWPSYFTGAVSINNNPIVGSGQTAYGYYTKFYNGIVVMYRDQIELSANAESTTYVYPVPLVATPHYISFVKRSVENTIRNFTPSNIGTSACVVNVRPTTNWAISCSALIIGRWY